MNYGQFDMVSSAKCSYLLFEWTTDIEPVLIWVVLSGIIYFHIANRPISLLIKSQRGTLLALLLRTLAMGTGY